MTRDEAILLVERTLDQNRAGMTRRQREAVAGIVVDALLESGHGKVAITGTEEPWQDDPWDHPEAQRFAEGAATDMFPKMERSAMSISLVPKQGDVKFWCELGAAIMLDKPLISVVLHEDAIAQKLRMVSDEIIVAADGMDDQTQEELKEAIGRVLSKLGIEPFDGPPAP